MTGPCPAHVVRFDPPLTGAADGPLAGLRVAVKDNFDVAGYVTGGGHPLWAAQHGPAETTAPLVQGLLDAGAALTGKTQMDELAYGLMGQNAHFGTPLNPAAPDRVPGGSSSGSASAVAAGEAEVGLGSDTGGSVRIPASFCGLWGWRPTHGLLPSEGLLALAGSYDVPGFLTRDAATLLRLAETLCPETGGADLSARSPADLWEAVPGATAEALAAWRAGPGDRLFDARMFATLLPAFRVCQAADVAEQFGDWVRANEPEFGPGVRERFQWAISLDEGTRIEARAQRLAIVTHVLEELGQGGMLLVPTAPGAAPLLTCDGAEMEAYRNAALTLLCVAGHAGLPQVSLPLGSIEGAPLGLSLIGPRGTDLALIRQAAQIAALR